MARVADADGTTSGGDGSPRLHGSSRSRPLAEQRSESAADLVQISSLGSCSKSPLQVLHLNKEVLLFDWQRRLIYQCVHLIARILPALVIYGGTLGLFVCAMRHYRWGVLVALTLYSFYMLHLCCTFLVFSAVGLLRVYLASDEDWHARYNKQRERQLSRAQDERLSRAQDERPDVEEKWRRSRGDGPYDGLRGGDMQWHDVLHVVVVPTYKTPKEVLLSTVQALSRFSDARTNMIVCLAFEEREQGSGTKAEELKEDFKGQFRSIIATSHPPNLPNHVPGKSSNECWAFAELCRELQEAYGFSSYDPRVLITIIDDDSELHENYFECLTYQFVTAPESVRYLSTWQPPICHFKNYLRQPVLVRISALFSTLHELSCLANPIDCHVPYSSYSLSLVLASSVGGWDPEYLAEDWHMFAKCSLMSEGRIRCQPIFLPLLNYTPEENTYWGTVASRWTQAKRHALGVSELVYVLSSSYLALVELKTPKRILVFLWRISPLLAKFTQVHFVNGMSAVWNLLAQLVIHFYMWRSWCYLSDIHNNHACTVLGSDNDAGIAEEQIILNSWLVYWQQRATALMASLSILSGGLGAFYFHLVKDRVEGDVAARWDLRYVWIMWLMVELEVCTCGLASSVLFGAAPLWIACLRVVQGVRRMAVAKRSRCRS
mmetsp:Transcript_102843/g.219939  ORF Transcript_102843/g.219939 Transcript_102843/m.219939 type:complete len:661 (-) Transcript_102843:25-2007(-)